MNILVVFCALFLLLSGTACAQNPDPLDSYQWSNRVLLVYAADDESPTYQQQIQEFEQHQAGVEDRDLVIFTVLPQSVVNPVGEALPPQSAEYLRQRYDVPGQQFAVVLIGKDGGVKLKEEKFLSTDKLFGTIDQMPMRQREMRDN